METEPGFESLRSPRIHAVMNSLSQEEQQAVLAFFARLTPEEPPAVAKACPRRPGHPGRKREWGPT